MAPPFPAAVYDGDARRITIKADNPLFYLNVQSGFNRILPTEPLRSGMEIYREFIDENGEAIKTFTQGQEATVQLRIRSLESTDWLWCIASNVKVYQESQKI